MSQGGLAAYLHGEGKTVGVLKPVETGCRLRQGTCIAQDAEFLKTMSGTVSPLDDIVPYRLRAPLAPDVAARMEGVQIRMSRIERAWRRISAAHEVTLVEGAGGLLVPYTSKHRTPDVIRSLGLPVLVVARAGLGTINHTLLTVERLEDEGLTVVGIVLNEADGPCDPSGETNPETLKKWTRVPLLGQIPHAPDTRLSARTKKRVASMVGAFTDLHRLHRELGLHP